MASLNEESPLMQELRAGTSTTARRPPTRPVRRGSTAFEIALHYADQHLDANWQRIFIDIEPRMVVASGQPTRLIRGPDAEIAAGCALEEVGHVVGSHIQVARQEAITDHLACDRRTRLLIAASLTSVG